MPINFKTAGACLAIFLLLNGCGTLQPVPFQLVDSSSGIQKGTIFPDGQRIEAVIDGQLYKGFYIVAGHIAFSDSMGSRLSSRYTVTRVTTNSARAQMATDKGQQLSCEFLFESGRAIGECKSPAGKIYQLNADGVAR
jgi:hypothetical protein